MEIFKKLNVASNAFMSSFENKNIYISHDNSKEIQPFLKDLTGKLIQYSIKYREQDSNFYKLKIKNANLFISIVTNKYFQSKLSLEEFEHALDSNKMILCLISSQILELENKEDDDGDANRDIRRYYLQTMRQFETLVVPADSMAYSIFRKIPNDLIQIINERIENLIQNDQVQVVQNIDSKLVPSFPIRDLKIKKEFDKLNADAMIIKGLVISKNEILVIIREDRNYRILLFDSNIVLSKVIESKDLNLFEPTLMTINNKSIIFIFDNSNSKISSFDNKMNKIAVLDTKLKDYNDMTVDEDTNDIYLVQCINRPRIEIINRLGKRIQTLNLPVEMVSSEAFKPRFIRVLKNQIFILNVCSIHVNQKTRVIIETAFGDSIIYILDKLSKEIKLKIDLNLYGLCQPWGLIVDGDLNIYTTVSQVDEKIFIQKERYLCKLNRSGDLHDCIKLHDEIYPRDLLFLNNSLIFFEETSIISYA